MARYRKIDPRIWNDAKFSRLSNDAKLLFIYLLTSPQTQMIGAIPMRAESVAAELGFDMERYGIRYQELYDMGIAEYDDRGLYWVKNYLKYNSPDNPKVVISWRECLDYLPECPLLQRIIESARAHCLSRGERYIEAFQKGIGNGMAYGIPNGMPYKEQEQEQEQEQELNNTNKQLPHNEPVEVPEAGEVCFESSVSDFADDLANEETQKVIDDSEAVVNPVQVIGLARMHGIKVYRSDRLNTIFRESVTNFDYAQNIVVIHTLPGLANAAASALDAMNMSVVLGTLAGDDTVFVVMRDSAAAASFCGEIKGLLG